ncbi:metal-dependent phosphoesterase [Candidatus Geothermarchaeota archaeon ex4572_27]|nr:MAG: metal-dependent phosphoesterase [Candidatus Geothermarchaeota archaeon ex4572_27]
MLRLDLHVHTAFSLDAGLRPEDVAREAIRRGLSGVAVTDHGTVRGGLEARRHAPQGFIVIPGVEVRTDEGDLLALFVEEEVEPGGFMEVVDRVRGMGGIAVLPHPYDSSRRSTVGRVEELAREVDAIEAFNSRCLSMEANERAARLATSLGKPVTAGSDAHFALELGRAVVLVEASDVEEVRKAILRGEVRVEGRLSPPYVHLMSRLIKEARRLKGLL